MNVDVELNEKAPDRLLITNRNPSKAYKWTHKKEDRYQLRLGQGWVNTTDPEVKTPFAVTAVDGTRTVGDLVLMEIPKELKNKINRQKAYARNNPIQAINKGLRKADGFSGKVVLTQKDKGVVLREED